MTKRQINKRMNCLVGFNVENGFIFVFHLEKVHVGHIGEIHCFPWYSKYMVRAVSTNIKLLVDEVEDGSVKPGYINNTLVKRGDVLRSKEYNVSKTRCTRISEGGET